MESFLPEDFFSFKSLVKRQAFNWTFKRKAKKCFLEEAFNLFSIF